MADLKMSGGRVSLMIVVFIFQVLSASFHGCFAAAGQVQPTWKRNTVRPTAVNGGSSVLTVSGNVYPLGYYSVEVGIGNPSKPFQLDIDTGSELTWVQCNAPCTGCTLPPGRQYKPKNNFLPCTDPICIALHGPQAPPCKNPNDKCGFKIEYADQGSVSVFMVKDTFPLRLVNGSLSSPPLAFGCGYEIEHSSQHPPPPTAGVLGLAGGKGSITSQLSVLGVTRDVVGHCFSVKGGGFLVLGADFIPKTEMTWTPMLQNPHNKHYACGPADLLFGGKPTGLRGLLFTFDSGSTYTYLSSNVYQKVLNLINKDLTGKPLLVVKDPALPICWKGRKPFKSLQDVKNYFTTLALSFGGTGNIQLKMPPQNYLIVTERGNACLGILDGTQVGLEDTNVIGDISLLNTLVIYDNENLRIGWISPVDCTRKLG